jgi:hypothetical protein
VKPPFINLFDIAGVLLILLPLVTFCWLAGTVQFVHVVNRHRQQKFGAWFVFAVVALVICLLRPEMLGVFLGIAAIYSVIWAFSQLLP